jgi:energy-coupling factor transporter ATP-binding protein EcfA2
MEHQETINNLELENFQWKQHANVLICSKKNSGKSILAKHLLSVLLQQHDYNRIVVFSATAKFSQNESFGFINHQLIFETVDDNVLEQIIKHQKQKIKSGNPSSIILVFDDVYLDVKSKVLQRLFCINRHLNIAIILITQYSKTMFSSTVIRSNIDYMFWSNVSQQSLDGLYHSVFTKMSLKEFYNFTHTQNRDFNFLFYNNTYIHDDEKFFIVKAKRLENIKITKKKGVIKTI